MKKIWFFNPDNDVALAADPLARFTPPAAALELRRSGALLPMWWAAADDEVLVESDAAIEGAGELRRRFATGGTAVRRASAGSEASPWGWSATSARIMSEAGAAGVPSVETIARLREISHRRTSIGLARAMGADERIVARECGSEAEALDAIDALGGRAIIKQPWSSSGRGVMAADEMRREKLKAVIGGTLRRQGSIMVEPHLRREADFAALFYSDGSRVKWRGVSVFATDGAGTYCGNRVAPQSELLRRIPVDISAAVGGAERYLTATVAQYYRGWMGVDMLAYRDERGRLQLDPCVELNLRMTMGVAAMLLHEKGLRGILRVKGAPAGAHEVNLSPIAGARFAIVVAPE